MMQGRNILLTGSTGLLGKQLLRLIIAEKNAKIFLLIRETHFHHNKNDSRGIFKLINKYNTKRNSNKVTLLYGDISKNNLGLDRNNCLAMLRNITDIYHCAALTGFRKSLRQVRRTNVVGTKNVLEFASRCIFLKNVNYISSVFVAGNYQGSFSEDNLDVSQDFKNYYEQSKFEAEKLVHIYRKKGMNILIYRPSIIVGESRTGKSTRDGLVNQFMRVMSLEIFEELPINRTMCLNMIPCDIAAKLIYRLSLNHAENFVYHIMSSNSVRLKDFTRLICNYLGCQLPRFMSVEKFKFATNDIVKKKILEPFLPYLKSKTQFCSGKTMIALQKTQLRQPKITKSFLLRLIRVNCSKTASVAT